MDKKLNIAFVWHMHQPLYKDPFSGEYIMPWVLLHGTKDYYDMAAILEEFPDIHQTFNLVPSLIEQLNDYATGDALDTYRIHSQADPAELTREEKLFILANFFNANWENAIKPLERYRELLKKRGPSGVFEDIEPVLRYFTPEDYLDLQVLFNLVWIDPMHIRASSFLSALSAKGGGYTEDEKAKLLDIQIDIIRKILPKHAQLMRDGIIEVSTTPYYHPIMPLLNDTDSALIAMPGVALPARRFTHPEDVEAQLSKGAALYEDTFGRAPVGLWPSEGSVCSEILPMVAEAGFKWMASDEEILSHTIKRPIRRDHEGRCCDAFLYKPYSIDAGGSSISVVFRDHVLSDLIGFDYQSWNPEDAANNMLSRLTHIHSMMEEPQDHLVSIILDGENAWEGYSNDGRDFLNALYSRLSGHPDLKCVTVSEFLASTDYREKLDWLYPGSWINHNFGVWIGHNEDNAAWDFISDAREALVAYEGNVSGNGGNGAETEAVKEAWEAIYAAEGSDWFWWYGDDHSSSSDEQFDLLFRRYIKKVYTLIKAEPPITLDIPIISGDKGTRPEITPSAYIDPVMDGEITNYFEWLGAGELKRGYQGAAMHREIAGGELLEAIHYAFSKKDLFFRFDYPPGVEPPPEGGPEGWSLTISFLHPEIRRICVTIKGALSSAAIFNKDYEGEWVEYAVIKRIASGSVSELAIPLALIGAVEPGEIKFFIQIDAADSGHERWPVKGFFIVDVPEADFELENWSV
jgi:alpha-amylase/alpha-mannosidase (GH57 family)